METPRFLYCCLFGLLVSYVVILDITCLPPSVCCVKHALVAVTEAGLPNLRWLYILFFLNPARADNKDVLGSPNILVGDAFIRNNALSFLLGPSFQGLGSNSFNATLFQVNDQIKNLSLIVANISINVHSKKPGKPNRHIRASEE